VNLHSNLSPLLLPYCGICDRPVERLKFDVGLNAWSWSFQAQCCGQTRGARLSVEEVLRVQATGEKYYAIPRRGHTQTIKPQARLRRAPAQRIWTR
jgi:hypothetical protein